MLNVKTPVAHTHTHTVLIYFIYKQHLEAGKRPPTCLSNAIRLTAGGRSFSEQVFGAERTAFGRLSICAPRARVSPEISRFTRRRAADDGINGMMAAAYCSYIAGDQPAAQTWDAFRETCDLGALLFLSLSSNFTTGRECGLVFDKCKY